MDRWCKIFEIDDQQILVWFEEDNGPGDFVLHQMISFEGMCADIAIQGITAENIQTAFEAIGEEEARLVLRGLSELVGDGGPRHIEADEF